MASTTCPANSGFCVLSSTAVFFFLSECSCSPHPPSNYHRLSKSNLSLEVFFFLLFSSFLKKTLFFREVLDRQQNQDEGTEIFHIFSALPPPPHIASYTINIPYQSDRIVISTSTISLLVQSWCCTVYGFGQMYNNVYPPLQYHTEYFHCLRNPLCFASFMPSYPIPPSLGNH